MHRTESKRLTRAKAAMKEKLLKIRHWCLEDQAEVINSILVGHYNYYGLAGNSRKLAAFWDFTKRHWRRCLSRRSQKGRVNWKEFNEILQKHPLAAPRIRMNFVRMDDLVIL